MTRPWLAEAPQGRSSWPRWLQTLAKARSVPSCPRVSSTPAVPRDSARWSPGEATASLRPTHIQPAVEEVALLPGEDLGIHVGARGSIRLWPKGRSEASSSARSIGAGSAWV